MRSAASSALAVSTMVSRTGAFCCASLLASADTSRLASPSSDPTAMVSVAGREYQRQPYRLAPAISTAIPATRVKRSQVGNLRRVHVACRSIMPPAPPVNRL